MVGRASPDELLAVATAGTRFASCLLLARILELPHPVNDPSHALARYHRWSRPDRADLAGLLARYGLEVFVIERNRRPCRSPRGVHRRRVVAHHAVRRRHRPVGAQSRSGLRLRIFLTAGGVSQGQADHAGIRLSAPQCLPATVLEALLRENLARHRNATTWFAAELVAFSRSDASATLRVRKDDAMVELSAITSLVAMAAAAM